MASLHVTHDNCFFPLNTAAVSGWMTGRAELSSCGRTLSVFPEGEEKGVPSWLRMTSNHSSGPALLLLHVLLLLYFDFRRKESPVLFLQSCLHASRLCKESRQPSLSGPLTDERCVCAVITIRNVRPSCFATPRSHTAPFSPQRSPSGCLSTVDISLNPQRTETTRKKNKKQSNW